MIADYDASRSFGDNYLPAAKETLRKHLGWWGIFATTREQDADQASDMFWLTGRQEKMIAFRVRQPGYGQYIHQFTLRRRTRNRKYGSEAAKIMAGHGDYFLYAHAGHYDHINGYSFNSWMLIDLDVFRKYAPSTYGSDVINKDGSEGFAFSVFSFPAEVCVASHNDWVSHAFGSFYPGEKLLFAKTRLMPEARQIGYIADDRNDE